MELSKKVAYLKGLMEGLKIDETTNEGKVLAAIADILDEMAAAIEDVADEVNEAVELIDVLDEDLGELEEDFYDLDDDDDDEEDDEDYEFGDDEELYECVCPSCGDTICLGENIIAEGSIECPNCGENLEFDFSEIEEDTEE